MTGNPVGDAKRGLGPAVPVGSGPRAERGVPVGLTRSLAWSLVPGLLIVLFAPRSAEAG